MIEGADAWWAEALDEAQSNRDASGAPVLPLAYLALTKLIASRVQDVADVSRMLGAASDARLDAVRGVVRQHAADLSDDLESLIALGKLEAESNAGGAPA